MRWASRVCAVVSASAALAPAGVQAQAPQTPPPAVAKEYKPGLADLMLAYIQPRHAKLGLAGAEGNWAQAMFSVTELAHAVQRTSGQVPKWRQLSIPEMSSTLLDAPIGSVVKAIKAQDKAAFQRSYQELTDGCNACHTTAGLEHIRIKPAVQSSFPDQDFAPTAK